MNSSTPEKALDVLIVGAGFSGLYLLDRLRDRGLNVQKINLSPFPLTKEHQMTPLSWAGNYLRRTLPDFDPADFGERKLTNILLATGEFEVAAFPHNSEAGQSIYYRSKRWSGKPEYLVFPRGE